MNTVLVKVRYVGAGYVARAGRGKKARIGCSSTTTARAAQRAAAKFFGLDASNVQTADDIVLTVENASDPVYRATLPETKGGASLSETLYICPRCYRHGFSKTGLSHHNCRGVVLPECRRRLTAAELAAARSYVAPVASVARPGGAS